MKKKYFGTDGVRGKVNTSPMTAETILRLGMAAGKYFSRRKGRHSVVIGKDTRLSGYMLEPALVAGLTAVGMDVSLFGPLPTPGVAMMTRSLRADMGVMLSASHNAYEDNGVKLFGPDGYKLDDETECALERLMVEALDEGLAQPSDLGRVKRIDDAQARYIEIVKASLSKGLRLNGLRVVVDCAHGATYKVAPAALWELGAEVVPIGVQPNGLNINDGCGSTQPQALQKAVCEYRADLGIALDGDGDRLILCDEKGGLVDGDQILALLAERLAHKDRLAKGSVVGTVMSNLGLERFLTEQGLKLERTRVGDRYIVERMRQKGYNLGGEPSGHLVLSDYSTTGDGLIAALHVLAAIIQQASPASVLLRKFTPAPQIMRNVRYHGRSPLEHDSVKAAMKKAEQALKSKGRLVVRTSGTEPVVRVMAEGEDETLIRRIVEDLTDIAQKIAA